MLTRIAVLAVLVGALFTGKGYAEEVNPVVGKVGDFALREADMDRLISFQSPEVQKKLEEEPGQRAELVRQLLVAKAVADQARKEGFERKPEVKEQLGYLIDDFLAREYLVRVVTAKVAISDEELKKYYQEHEKDFLLPESVKVRHIFVEVPKDASPEIKAKARTKAEAILQRLKKGEEYAKVAQETSEDPDTAANGGDLGYLSPGKTNAEEFEKAAFALKPGEISPVVETPFGYHIIKVDERKEKRTLPFEEAKDYIRQSLKAQTEQKKAQEFLDKVTKDSGLAVFTEKIAHEGQKKEQP